MSLEEIVRHEGDHIVRIGGRDVQAVSLYDWILCYVEFDDAHELDQLRKMIMQVEDELRIIKVTENRIYFEVR